MGLISDQKRRRIEELVDAGLNNTEIARHSRYGRNTVIRYANPHRQRQPEIKSETPAETPDAAGYEFREKGDDATVGLKVNRQIRTLEELIEVCKVDTAVWRVESWECTAWNSITKDSEKKAQMHQLYRVHAKLKRLAPKPLMDAMTSFFEKFRDAAPPYHPIKHRSDGNTVVEIDLCDVHFGKLAWREESGEDYDLRIAEKVFLNAIDDLLAEINGRNVQRILVPFGNDYAHIDSEANTTTGGTVVDTDGRLTKIYDVALTAKIKAMQRFRELAPVKLILVRGNHDRMVSFTMARAIKEHFRLDDRTEVDCTPALRKYELVGNTAILYQHGDHLNDSRIRDLPAIMTKEAPREMLARAIYHECHVGHKHCERKFTTRDVDTNVGFVTRWMHSLSAVDHWHFANHFIGSRRAAEVNRYDLELGFKGNDLALARST